MRTARPRHTVGGLLLAASWLLRATLASADLYPGGTRLSYTLGPGTASCIDEEAFRDTVAAQLDGIDRFTPDGAWRFGVTITRARGGFKGEITLHDGEGKPHGRDQIAAPTCRETVNAVANGLVAALFEFPKDDVPAPAAPPPAQAQAPTKALRAPPVSQSASAEPPHPARGVAQPVPVAAGSPSSPTAPRIRPRLELGAGLLIAQGFAPDLAAGFVGALGFRWPDTSLLIEARGDPPTSSKVVDGATIETSWMGGSLVGCRFQTWLFGCGLVTAGRVRGVGLSDELPWVRTKPYVGVGLRAGVEVPFSSRFAGQISADFVVDVDPPRIRVHQVDLWSAPPLSQVVGLRLVTFF